MATLIYQGQTYTNSDATWLGINVPRSEPTQFSFLYNSVTSVNTQGYMLQAGDEVPTTTNNNLDNEVISGNKFVWNGTDMTSITHGVFTGHNVGVIIKYNYLLRVPMAIIRKSSNSMVDNTGYVIYNIVNSCNDAANVKGMSNTRWYNNTFYQDRSPSQTWRPLFFIYDNTDSGYNSPARGTKIKNNIFYLKYRDVPAIGLGQTDNRTNFECDYNVYWCEDGDHTPTFTIAGTTYSWDQWRALGYDTHSVVVNPNFNNFTDFVPATRLDYGTNLGTEFQTGLSTSATWVVGTAPATTVQNGTWQVGARIYAAVTVVVPTVTTSSISSITSTTASGGGNVTSDGGSAVTERGVCWDQSGYPALDNNHTHDGAGTGIFTSNITGLTPGTTYYVKAYATNSAGTAYGNLVSFTTSIVLPTVTTTSITNITSTTATSGGNVTSSGGATVTARGVCWSTSQNPTISNSKTTDGTGTGSFTSSITGLSPNTTYYVRAYATNSVGTAYGSQVSFTTTSMIGTTYYVKNGGNDNASGLSDAEAWATLTKVNSRTFNAGDKILFRCGDTWYGTLNLSSSGTATNRITIDSYGSGEKPKITGFSTVSSFSVYSGSIYRCSLSSSISPNVVSVNGVNTPMGRYPNSSSPYRWQSTDLTIDSYTSNSITDATLPSSPDLDGAEIVIRTQQWVTETRKINHNGQTLTLQSGNFYYTPAGAGVGYFLRNHLSFLDQENEWYFGNNYFYIYGNPSGKVIKVSTLSNLINLTNSNYVTIQNIQLEGSNSYSIYATNSSYLIVNNCDILFGGNTGIHCETSSLSPTIRYCNISNMNNYGIITRGIANVTIEYNNISYTGYINGAGGSGDEDYTAIVATGNNTIIRYNRIIYTGYDAIRYGGQNTNISYNFINYACLNKSDGAGIYAYRDFATGKVIDHNIVMNCTPQKYGWFYEDNTSASAIYTDGTEQTTFSNNVFAYSGKGMFINSSRYITTNSNLCFDNIEGIEILSQSGELARNQSHTYNIYFARYNNQHSMYIVAVGLDQSELCQFGTSNYNYFLRPISNDNYIATNYNAWGGTYNEINLNEWKSLCSKDANSSSTPVTVSSDSEIHFIYNDTFEPKSYIVVGTLKDHTNQTYSGTFILQPFTAIVLMGVGSVSESTGVTLPSVTTTSISNITLTTATGGGNVTSDGGATVTARGVCWSTSQNPTISNSKTTDGTGTGSFTSSITGLSANTTYYVRAYATNSVGTAYGSQVSFTTSSATYYLSPTGNDNTGNGTLVNPWFSLNKAWTVAGPGVTIYMKGGTYQYTTKQTLTGKNGTLGNMINVWAVDGEYPVITHASSWSPTYPYAGVQFTGNYVYFKGIKITGFTQQTEHVWTAFNGHDINNCIFEKMEFCYSGLGSYIDGACSGNLFLNCDWYENYDPLTVGDAYGNADGCNFENVSSGGTNTFRGCRFWNNSDDGLDLYNNESYVIIENCWAWGQGFREDRVTKGGNGDGFKLGPTVNTGTLRKVVNCLSFNNNQWGYNYNDALCNMQLYHCNSYNNGRSNSDWSGGYWFMRTGVAYDIKNCISYNDKPSVGYFSVTTNVTYNSWQVATVADNDFITLSTTGVNGARLSDGSLPVLNFMKLATGSDLIQTGVAITGITADGAGIAWKTPPSIGAYEYVSTVILPTVTTTSISNITSTTATSGGNVTSDGGATVTARGVCWSTSQNPTISNSKTTDGTGTGSFTSSITGLIPATTYYVRAYATNSAGTAYGSQVSFTTSASNFTSLLESLISYWKLDETSGTIYDSYGSNHSTSVSATYGVVGKIGTALYFNGTNNSVTLTNNTSAWTVSNSGNLSISCWLKMDSTIVTANILGNYINGQGPQLYVDIDSGLACFKWFIFGTGVGDYYFSWNSSSWYHIVMTKEGSTIKFYINGSLVDTGYEPSYTTLYNGTWYIGNDAYSEPFKGTIDEVGYWQKCLTAQEVLSLYNNGNGLTYPFNNTVLPTITTTSISNVTLTTATGGGNVTSDGGATVTARGVCWSTSQNPTISNSKTTDGTGTGSFTSSINGLSSNTTYYVRAYATNSAGTAYGSQVSFTTSAVIPTVTTTSISNITSTTASGGGNVTLDGGATVIARGVCWSTSQNPTISNSKTTDGSGTGTFTSSITGLSPNTTYYVRAYATNSAGTAYGSQVSFTTLYVANVYYIDPNGSDSTGNGSPSSPWKSLRYACSQVTTAGNTIHVNQGTYYENEACYLSEGVNLIGDGKDKSIIISSYNNGDPTSSYTILGLLNLKSNSQNTNGNQRISGIKFDGNNLAGNCAIIVYNRGHVQIDNCHFKDFNYIGIYLHDTQSWYTEPTNYAEGNWIHHNIIDNCGYANMTPDPVLWGSVQFGGQKDFIIEYNEFYNMTRYGLYNGTAIEGNKGFHKGLIIRYNKFYRADDNDTQWNFFWEIFRIKGGCEIYENEFYGAGVCDFANPYGTDNIATEKGDYDFAVKMHHNRFYTGPQAIAYRGKVAIEFEASNSDIYVYDNYVENFGEVFALSAGTSNLTYNNIFVFNNIGVNIGYTDSQYSWGIIFSADYYPTYNNIYICHNTIIGRATTKPKYGIKLPGEATTASNFIVRNNIIRGFQTAVFAGQNWVSSGDITFSNLHIDNNNFYNSDSTIVFQTGCNSGSNYTANNNITTNPLFITDYTNLHLQSSSPCIFAGMTLSYSWNTTDYDNVAWKTPPSIGAYEYNSDVTVPTVTTTAITNITSTTATGGGNVTSSGGATVTARGVCWSTSQNPTISNSKTSDGTGTGSFTSSITGLTPATTYYVRAYATNSTGTAYGSQISFTTSAVIPTVITTSISNLTSTSATSGGNVTSSGGATVTARGVCWSTSQNPTISNSKTTDGSGTGTFTSSITGLSPNTTYYVRAYATNSIGTAYGSQVSFTTSSGTYYVSTTGNDNNPGTLELPWATWQKALDVAVAGDIVYIRGGVYYPGNVYSNGTYNGAVRTSRNGTSANPIKIWAYPGETPILDGTNVNANGVHIGLSFENCSYYYLKGLIIRNFTEYGKVPGCPLAKGIQLNACSYFTLERIVIYNCGNGFASGGFSDYNQYIDCDAYDCYDYSDSGGYANGFSLTYSHAGAACHTTLTRCRAWNCSDDGFDFFASDGSYKGGYITLDKCWAFNNGWGPGGNGNGSGFKLGQVYGKETGVQRTITNCLAFGNRGAGFDESMDSGAYIDMNIFNNTAYGNGDTGFSFGFTYISGTVILRNNISYANTNGNYFRTSGIVHDHNSWDIGGITVNDADFISVNSSGASGSRQSDGNLPNLNFLKLAVGSDLIYKGTPVGLTTDGAGNLWNATTPSIGAYEYQATTNLATVSTTSISNITITTATGGGNVTADGGSTVTAKGICWATTQNPTIVNFFTNNGTGTGSFTSNMTGLSPNTTYYVRAYATNSVGTAYGSQVSFTTLSNVVLPTVTTPTISNITTNSATATSNVTSDGNGTVTARGVCWSTSQNPTTANSKTTDGTGTGSFTSSITGLTPGTTYYVRAYATNSAGTTYSSQVSFTTIQSPYIVTYYVDSVNGNDANVGTSEASAWKTISRVNQATLNAGTGVLFKRGQTFYGTLIVNQNGTSGNPITFSAYGTGENPKISGFTTPSSWTNIGNGVYYTSITPESSVNMVVVDGSQYFKGKFPDVGWATIDSATATSLTSSSLSNAYNFTGSEVVIRKNRWIIDVLPILSHNGNTITFSDQDYDPRNGWGFFIQNDASLLNSFGEWAYESNTNRLYMYFGTEIPGNHTIKISTLNTNISTNSIDYVTIKNLTLEGANINSMVSMHYGGESTNIIIEDCSILFSGRNAIYIPYGQNCIVRNNIFNYINDSVITIEGGLRNVITNNIIKNNYINPGLGSRPGDGVGFGINSTGDYGTISYNQLINCGYIPINYDGTDTSISFNYIDTYCFVKDDGGAIYCYYDNNYPGRQTTLRRKVVNNIILNAIGASEGTGTTETYANGLYTDGFSSNVLLSGNTIYNVAGAAFHANIDASINFINNNVYQAPTFVFLQRYYGISPAPTNNSISGNVFISTRINQRWGFMYGINDGVNTYNQLIQEISNIGYIDNNYYYTDKECFFSNYQWGSNQMVIGPYNFERWKTVFGHDTHSTMIPRFTLYDESSIGTNKISNSTFISNITGWYTTNSSVAISWVSSGGLDSGCMRVIDYYTPGVEYSPMHGPYTSVTGGIDNSKNYLLRISSISGVSDKIIGVAFQTTAGGEWLDSWNNTLYFGIDDVRTDRKILIKNPTQNGIYMKIDMKDDKTTTYLDNIYLYELLKGLTEETSYFQFEYNASIGVNKTITLDSANYTYRDVYGNSYTNSITLAPFTSITLLKEPIVIAQVPTVTTTPVTDISAYSAKSGGNVTNNGGATVTARGVCWSKSINPTVSLLTKTVDGSGTGSYVSNLANLDPSTHYYVRAYATNSAGTGYGNNVEFDTPKVSGTTLLNGLMGYWKLDETTGAVLDSQGVFNGTNFGATRGSTGKIGTAYTFAAAENDYVDIGKVCKPTTGITLTSWIYPSIQINDWAGIIINLKYYGPADQNGYSMFIDSSKLVCELFNRTNYAQVYSNTIITPNTWHFVALTWNGTTVNVYVDSIYPDASAARTTLIGYDPDSSLRFGSHSPNYDYNGRLDEVGIWNRALTPDELYMVYNNGNGLSYPFNISLTTSIPTVTTNTISNIGTNSATCGGNVILDGSLAVIARGVCWATSPNPTIANYLTNNGVGKGTFISNLTGLNAATTYYVRAYATNSLGTAYGSIQTFTTLSVPTTQSRIINHNCTVLSNIPLQYINAAKNTLHIAYTHTSHGSQIITGMTALDAWKGGGTYAWNEGGTDGALDIDDYAANSLGADDLGNPDWTAWATATRTYLSTHPTCNVVMWSWCGQVSSATESNINTYLSLMNQLELDYPNVKFIYMTGHLDGTGVNGNLNLRNQQIRNYCITNNKWLYDFADIESYDPDGNEFLSKYANDNCDYNFTGTLDRNWAIDWQNSHTENVDWFMCYPAHTQALNGNLKAYAAWHLWARLAGWDGIPITAPIVSTNSVTNISTYSITSGGTIISDGGSPITERGVCWNTSINPTLLNSHTHDGSGTGSYVSSVVGLNSNTSYYVRAYATNSVGTGYGENLSFTTLSIPIDTSIFYVSPTGLDSPTRNGGIGQEWASLSYACSRVTTPNSTIRVNSGNYVDNNLCTLSPGVSITGYGPTIPNIVTNYGTGGNYGYIRLYSSSPVNGNQSISYLNLNGNNLAAYRAIFVMRRSNVSIHHCSFTNFYNNAILFYDEEPVTNYSLDNKVYDCSIVNCCGFASGVGGSGAVQISGQRNFEFYNNTVRHDQRTTYTNGNGFKTMGYIDGLKIHHNTFYGDINSDKAHTDSWDFCIELWGQVKSGIEIYNNTIYNNEIDIAGGNTTKGTYQYSVYIHDNSILISSSTLLPYKKIGIIIEQDVNTELSDVLITKNHFKNISNCIEFYPTLNSVYNNIRIQCNLFENIGKTETGWNQSWGIRHSVSSGPPFTTTNWYIENNTFVAATVSGAYESAAIKIWNEVGAIVNNIYIRNNIITNFEGFPVYTDTQGALSNFYFTYNDVYNCGNPIYMVVTPTNSDITTGNLTSNPYFMSTTDFHLSSNSTVIKKGTYIGLTTDFDGVPWSIPYPSMGAFEYVISGPTSLPILVTSAITDISTRTATSGGNVIHDGSLSVTNRGVCWSTSSNPTILSSHTEDGVGEGLFTSYLTGLNPSTHYYVRAYATNSLGTAYGQLVEFNTLLNTAVPTVTTSYVTNIGITSASCGGTVVLDGSLAVISRGVCWSTSPNPTTSNSFVVTGSGKGSFVSNMLGLNPSTLYYVRAFAVNAVGTGYGSDVSFNTLPNVSVPIVTTTAITDISVYTATGGGNVIHDGSLTVVSRGICWSTTINPTVINSSTSNGSGKGTFTSYLTGLNPSTYYYVRAYAVNSAGIAYGSNVTFSTLLNKSIPILTTAAITNVSTNSATSGGTIVLDGSAFITAKGICWSTSPNPTIANFTTNNGTGNSSFVSNLTNLNPSTYYYVRAYATNSEGTGYGNTRTFATLLNIFKPTVITSPVTNITVGSAISGGNVTVDGNSPVTAKGVCWSTSLNPTVANSSTNDGTGLGSYVSSIIGLNSSTNYHVRAYAVNAAGISYGADVSFNTPKEYTVPGVITNGYSHLSANSVKCKGTVVFDGNSAVTSRGFCWSTTEFPTISDSSIRSGTGVGSFTSTISGLNPSTHYHIRAWAVNTTGVGYGTDISINTLKKGNKMIMVNGKYLTIGKNYLISDSDLI